MKSIFPIAERISSLIASIILLQTLNFKFTAHADSVYIFTQLGLEPIGRIGIGFIELIAGLMLLFRRSSLYGAVLGFGIIIGAIFSHLFVLGIVVNHDGGKLFFLAIVVLIACGASLFFQKNEIKKLINKFI